MAELPTGTVTFLITDIEGSTRLWEEHPDAMPGALARHDEILHRAIERHAGIVLSRMGDGVAAVFASAPDGLRAALEAQMGLGGQEWGETGPLRVRMGMHADEGRLRAPGEYVNRPLNRCARLMAIAHGGQMVVSDAVAALTRDSLPEQSVLVDLGDHRLRDLAGPVRVFQLVHAGLPEAFPPLRSLDVLPGNLPRQVTTFVGRETETASLAALVSRSSLVTLTGVGGVGKTRLALQVAAEAVVDFADGAWLCELAPVTDPGAVWETLASSLRVPAHPGLSLDESVLEFLAAKQLLLVLDNCEHLLSAVAQMVDTITRRCSRVAVLATSREGLAVAGERIVAVTTLPVPVEGSDLDGLLAAPAVQLFSDRAAAAKDGFVVTDGNASAVGMLCRRLDGIPLAIELAAARLRSLSPDDLVARLDQRFKLLTKGSRAALERQQTLRSTIDWSYDLLEPTERHGLDRLSVFAGGCDLAAAEAVLADAALDGPDVIDVLGQLVDKSLVIAEDDDGVGVRYRLLETVRQYAQERLEAGGETDVVRRRHAGHYVEVAESAGPHLRSREQLAWAEALARDLDNLRGTVDWAVEAPAPEIGLRLVAPLAVTGMAIGDAAGDWADTVSTIPGADGHPLFPEVAAFASLRATLLSDLERAEARVAAAEEAPSALDPPHPSVLRARAVLAMFSGDFETAQGQAEAWVALARRTGDTYELPHALVMLASTLLLSEPETAIAALDEAVAIARDAGLRSALSIGLSVLANVLPIDRSERTRALIEEAIDVGNQIGDASTVSFSTAARGWLDAHRGEWRTALETAVDAAEQLLHIGNVAPVTASSFDLAAVAFCALGHFEAATVLIGRTDAMFPDRRPPDWAATAVESTRDALVVALGEQRVATLGGRGAALDFRECVEYLRAQATLALEDA